VAVMRSEWYDSRRAERLLGKLLFPVCIDHVFLNIWHDRGMRLEAGQYKFDVLMKRQLTLYSMENSPITKSYQHC
jgi:hypothetical protein